MAPMTLLDIDREGRCLREHCKCGRPKANQDPFIGSYLSVKRDEFFNPVTNNSFYEKEKAMAEVRARLEANAKEKKRKATVNLILDAEGLAKYITEVISLQDKTKRVRVRATAENDYADYKTVDKRPDEMTASFEGRVNEDGKFVIKVDEYTLDELNTKKNREAVASSFGTVIE